MSFEVEILEQIHEANKEHFLAHGGCMPSSLLIKNFDVKHVPMMFTDTEHKMELIAALKERVKHEKPDFVVHVQEAWMVARSKDYDPEKEGTPSEQADRFEVLITLLERPDGQARRIMTNIIRDGDSVTLDNDQVTDLQPSFGNLSVFDGVEH